MSDPAQRATLRPVGRDSVEPANIHPHRSYPASGVYSFPNCPTIAFLTICTLQRQTGLATRVVHEALLQAWAAADDWLIGDYLLMPDHIHLFCAPQMHNHSIEEWITFWKRRFRIMCKSAPRFQSRGFHHRLRRSESYDQKVNYVRDNPVRAGLVREPEDWEFKGQLNVLPWWS
jgi:REP-associated tyrosine transposase